VTTAHIHICDSCRGPHIAAPPASLLSPPEPPPPPSPLFDRPPHSHLPLASIERSAAVVLTRIGETQQQAAEQLGTTRQSVSHWQHTYEETNDIKDALRSGRPTALKEKEKEELVMVSTINNRLTPRELKKEVGVEVSARTIDRTLQEADLFGRVALKKRKFDEEEMKKRLSFAEGYKHWRGKEWERVLFADEAIVKGEGGVKGGRQWVRRERGTAVALQSEYIHHKTPHPKQLNVWGCFAASGLGYSYIYNESLNGKGFTHILDTHLLQSADLLFPETPRRQWWLLQDNAPTHKANVSKKWLHNHGVDCLDFPPYSPDLNPIENLWQHVEKRVEARAPTELDELQNVLAEEWEKTPKSLLIKLAHSMPKRCLDVIAAHGDHIHY
jgi:transposase